MNHDLRRVSAKGDPDPDWHCRMCDQVGKIKFFCENDCPTPDSRTDAERLHDAVLGDN